MTSEIVLVDDDESILNVFKRILTYEGHNVHIAKNGEEGLKLLEEVQADLIITDMYMPKLGGLAFIKKVKESNPNAYIMVITGEGTIENVVKAMKLGAYSYVQKPINVDAFLMEVNKILELASKINENKNLKALLYAQYDSFIGENRQIDEMKEKIIIIAETDSTVLITGESGTGKELVAQSIHNNSNCSDSVMIKVNCAALLPTLLESELFGHEKGAFTGAHSLKKGLFELADGGTLFLDEIGEMAIAMQSKLLRVIQEKNFVRVGGHKPIHSNFRLVCATNKDLLKEVKEGNFREDLFYRLNVIPIEIIPLRERKDDIELLLNYYIKKYSEVMGKTPIILSSQYRAELSVYRWPGNVRELKNMIERLTVFSNNGIVRKDELFVKKNEQKHSETLALGKISDAKDDFEKNYIIRSLEQNKWQITKTSIQLGLARKNLYAKMKKYNIKKKP